jgi:hypothetical protein
MAQADSYNSTLAPAAEKPQDSIYLPTDTTPEQLFRAIGKLRKDARDEIDRLIRFLDETDNHMELEPDDEGDDSDLEDGGDDEDDGLSEPSLGSMGHYEHSNQELWARGGTKDLEDEHDGAEPDECGEPSLGSLDRITNQEQSWHRENPFSIDMERAVV